MFPAKIEGDILRTPIYLAVFYQSYKFNHLYLMHNRPERNHYE